MRTSLPPCVFSAKEVHREGGNEGSGKDIGCEHGEHDGFGEGNEEKARDAAQEKHGQEDDADGESGDQRGNCDLGGAFEDGVALGVAPSSK